MESTKNWGFDKKWGNWQEHYTAKEHRGSHLAHMFVNTGCSGRTGGRRTHRGLARHAIDLSTPHPSHTTRLLPLPTFFFLEETALDFLVLIFIGRMFRSFPYQQDGCRSSSNCLVHILRDSAVQKCDKIF